MRFREGGGIRSNIHCAIEMLLNLSKIDIGRAPFRSSSPRRTHRLVVRAASEAIVDTMTGQEIDPESVMASIAG
jgi:hypothetical protein